MKRRSWRPWIFGGLAFLLLACVGLLLWVIPQFGWDWTGFIAYTPPTPQFQRGKTLWDWLQLLIVPVILAASAGFFTWWSARTEQQIAKQRYERDQQIADQRYKQDQELALEKQHEDLLQSYLDRMADLLIREHLCSSKPDAEARMVARTRTISTLIQLDNKRARTVFVFLKEAQLLEELDPVLSFKNADLSIVKWGGINLSGFSLSGANLSEATLSRANLSGANLSGANLSGADLSEATLSEANLSRANLSGATLSKATLIEATLIEATLSRADLSMADLSRADLSGADLSGANLSRADLSGADLSRANLSEADLSRANLSRADLSGATLSRADLSRADLR
jgi:uncharacterized protein YjbI with pentapeptide repeats